MHNGPGIVIWYGRMLSVSSCARLHTIFGSQIGASMGKVTVDGMRSMENHQAKSIYRNEVSARVCCQRVANVAQCL